MVDWLPWNHTFGGNHDFGLVLHNGGSLYIDEGKPLPGAIEATVRNLREIAPTIYLNVPKGFEMLLPYLRTDAALRKNFFSRLKVLFYAGAGLAQHVWDELQEMASPRRGERIIFLSSLGSTETAPAALARTWESGQPGNIGVPMRGVELKLVPNEGKLEGRYKGPNITPGYWRRPDLTKEAFDDEGFYKIGDALKFDDASRSGQRPPVRRPPRRGLQARKRHLGQRRRAARAVRRSLRAARSRRGDRRPEPRRHRGAGVSRRRGLPQACGPAADAPPAAVLAEPKLRDEFKKRLDALARQSTGGSTRICRMILMAEPPSLDAGEATDKGSINQRAVLTRRAALVEELYAPVAIRQRHRNRRTEISRMDPKGHAAIVTGAASGLGAETAAHLAQRRRQGRLPRHQSRRRQGDGGKDRRHRHPLRRHQLRRCRSRAQGGARQARPRAHPDQLRRRRTGQAHGRPRRADAARRVREGHRGQPHRHLQHDAARRRRHAERCSRSPTASAA